MKTVRRNVELKQREEDVARGILKDIPGEYNISLPFTDIEQVQDFSKNLFCNNLGSEGGPRNRRLELVSCLSISN